MKDFVIALIAAACVIPMFIATIITCMIQIGKLRRKNKNLEQKCAITDKIINYLDSVPMLNPLYAMELLEIVKEYKAVDRPLPHFAHPPAPPEKKGFREWAKNHETAYSSERILKSYGGWELQDADEDIDDDDRSDIDTINRNIGYLMQNGRDQLEIMREKAIYPIKPCIAIININPYEEPLSLELKFQYLYEDQRGITSMHIGEKLFYPLVDIKLANPSILDGNFPKYHDESHDNSKD